MTSAADPRSSRIRLVSAALAAVAFALGALGPAAARSEVAPRYGGTLVVGLARGDPSSLDPTVGRGISAGVVMRSFCEQLYDYDANFQLVPVLAAAVPVLSKDKLSETVQLRKGIQFNDGTPFNAQAVVTSVNHYRTYSPPSPRAEAFFPVASVSATGPYTVVFRLKARNSQFQANTAILSPTQLAKLGDNFASNPVCVGPFMYDDRVVLDHVTVVKSPYYYDQKDVYLDKIVYKTLPDAAAATAALKAGDVQVLDRVSTTELPDVRQTSNLRVVQRPQFGWSGVVINIGNENGYDQPYSNVGTPLANSAKLRQAFEEAIDRNTLNTVVFGGLFHPSCTPIPSSNTDWYGTTKVPCTPYNPTDAKKLVAGSGLSNPTVHLLTTGAGDFPRLAQFIQAQEAAVGINVVIDLSATADAQAVAGHFDTYLRNLVPSDPDPGFTLYRDFGTTQPSNRSGYSNPRMDLILSNALKASDPKARSTLYHAAQQILAADRPIIVLYNMSAYAAFSATLTGVRLDSGGQVDVVNARFK